MENGNSFSCDLFIYLYVVRHEIGLDALLTSREHL